MKVTVLGGGRSSEHEVSLDSAKAVREGLRSAGHEVHSVEIDKQGRWNHAGKEISLVPGSGLLDSDVVFPALHGPYGEDGTIQGLLEHLDVPYVGCGSLSSAICMDKALSKEWLRYRKMPQPKYVTLRHPAGEADRAAIGKLGYPVFVKPSRLGSSIGISRVESPQSLDPALTEAFEHDSVVVVEAAVDGREIECGVLGSGSELTVSEPGEIVVKDGWYDYEKKYTPGLAEVIIPAVLERPEADAIKGLAEQVFKAFGCAGLARIDFFLTKEGPLVSEVNTMPGFTQTSAYPRLMETAGVPFPELLTRLIEDARSEHRAYREREH